MKEGSLFISPQCLAVNSFEKMDVGPGNAPLVLAKVSKFKYVVITTLHRNASPGVEWHSPDGENL